MQSLWEYLINVYSNGDAYQVQASASTFIQVSRGPNSFQ